MDGRSRLPAGRAIAGKIVVGDEGQSAMAADVVAAAAVETGQPLLARAGMVGSPFARRAHHLDTVAAPSPSALRRGRPVGSSATRVVEACHSSTASLKQRHEEAAALRERPSR